MVYGIWVLNGTYLWLLCCFSAFAVTLMLGALVIAILLGAMMIAILLGAFVIAMLLLVRGATFTMSYLPTNILNTSSKVRL